MKPNPVIQAPMINVNENLFCARQESQILSVGDGHGPIVTCKINSLPAFDIHCQILVAVIF